MALEQPDNSKEFFKTGWKDSIIIELLYLSNKSDPYG
jgi:hypothetical protein